MYPLGHSVSDISSTGTTIRSLFVGVFGVADESARVKNVELLVTVAAAVLLNDCRRNAEENMILLC